MSLYYLNEDVTVAFYLELVKSARTAALIPLCIVVALATKTNDAPKLNADAWINCPSQLHMIKPHVVPCGDLDPSMFTLMNPPNGFVQMTH